MQKDPPPIDQIPSISPTLKLSAQCLIQKVKEKDANRIMMGLEVKKLTLLHTNNKCADQTAHPCSLVCAFLIPAKYYI